jgi:D-threo-aldose 1-dehydrogenase
VTAELGLGCAPLGNLYAAISDEEAAATVDAAWDAGIRVFDTAPLYGHGLSERRLGAALQRRNRAEFRLSTKVGRLLVDGTDPHSIFVDVPPLRPVFDFSYDGVLRSFDASLSRLGLDRVDVLLVHDPDDFAEDAINGAFPALRRLRDEGVVSAIGAGMNQTAMLARFVREACIDCVLVAGRWTLLDRSAAQELFPLCIEHDVDVMVGGVFNSGLLARPVDGATYDYVAAPPDLVASAQRMDAQCRAHGVALTSAALQFASRHPAVKTVLTGARSADEVRSNADAFNAAIPDSLWAELDG